LLSLPLLLALASFPFLPLDAPTLPFGAFDFKVGCGRNVFSSRRRGV
jgi:hypothetical protein